MSELAGASQAVALRNLEARAQLAIALCGLNLFAHALGTTPSDEVVQAFQDEAAVVIRAMLREAFVLGEAPYVAAAAQKRTTKAAKAKAYAAASSRRKRR